MGASTATTGHFAQAIDECREHAAYCARKAKNIFERDVRDDFLQREQSWLQLARAYEFAQAMMEYSSQNDNAA